MKGHKNIFANPQKRISREAVFRGESSFWRAYALTMSSPYGGKCAGLLRRYFPLTAQPTRGGDFVSLSEALFYGLGSRECCAADTFERLITTSGEKFVLFCQWNFRLNDTFWASYSIWDIEDEVSLRQVLFTALMFNRRFAVVGKEDVESTFIKCLRRWTWLKMFIFIGFTWKPVRRFHRDQMSWNLPWSLSKGSLICCYVNLIISSAIVYLHQAFVYPFSTKA